MASEFCFIESPLTEPRPVRVLLVDDHSITRDGLRLMLEGSGEFQVGGEARDGEEAVRATAELTPDVVVMEVLIPNKDGIEACREIMEAVPDTRVIMLTAATDEATVIEAVGAGAAGYLQKVSGMEQFLQTVGEVAAGELRVPAAVVRRVFAEISRGSKPEEELGPGELTQREREILALFASGMSYARIAKARGVASVTVRNAVYGIQRKLGAGSKQEIVVWAARNGLLDD